MSKEETQQKIGKVLTTEGYEDRDAIHIAVLPVVCARSMTVGTWVRFLHGSQDQVVEVEQRDQGIGIVDPFFFSEETGDWIEKGTKVWLFLKPNTITGLRHHWTHPLVDRKESELESERWLRQFADKWNFNYDDMIRAASAPSTDYHDNYVVAMDIDLHSAEELGEDHALFWEHLSRVTGRHYDEGHRERFGWSCSC